MSLPSQQPDPSDSPSDASGAAGATPPRAPDPRSDAAPRGDHDATGIRPTASDPQNAQMPSVPPRARERIPAPLRIALAWFVILSLSTGWLALHAFSEEVGVEHAVTKVSLPMEMGGRIMHSVRGLAMRFGLSPSDREQVTAAALTQIEPKADTVWIDRIAYVIAEAELRSPQEAIESLDKLGLPTDASDADQVLFNSVRDALVRWDEQSAAASPDSTSDGAAADSPSPRLALPAPEAARLGWYALLLSGTAPPTNLISYLVVAALWYIVFVLAGLVILGVGLTLALLGRISPRVECRGRSAVYAETFAVWMLLFFSLQLGLAQVLQLLDPEMSMVPAGLAGMFGSLLALAWPVFRGVRWADVRQDIGLHAGRGFLRECACGPLTYAASLPIMGLGFVAFALLRSLVGETKQPSHPVVEQLGDGPAALVAIFLLACVAAPIVEEIAFRGILYRHLREAGRFIGTIGSVMLATVVSSVLFAAIHPQGFLFIPILGGLASGFCLAREARGSILSGVVAHAINNAFTLALGVAIAQG